MKLLIDCVSMMDGRSNTRSLGESRPIHWQWYFKSQPIGERIKFTINNGDMYIMSEKTSGYDWKKRNLKTLRHAAGEKYVNT